MLFDITRYLTEKYFDIVWGFPPPRGPPNELLTNQFFEQLKLGCQFLGYQQILNRQIF